MDKEQIKVIKGAGYEISEVPAKKQPKITMYRPERVIRDGVATETGEVIEMPNLPADAASLKRYLSRGFSLERHQK